jgi:hypothetical protein
MKYKIRLLLSSLFTLFLIGSLSAQSFQVTGKVTNKLNGEPLSGATVNIKGTSNSVLTNEVGSFTISVPGKGGIIVVSYTVWPSRKHRLQKPGLQILKCRKETPIH